MLKYIIKFLLVVILIFFNFTLVNANLKNEQIKIKDLENQIGIKVIEFETGTLENQIGLIKTSNGDIPFGMYKGPSSFCIDDKNRLYVIDCINYRVNIYDLNTKKIIKNINYFTDKTHLPLMTDIALDSQYNIYLADNKNHNVIKFSYDGIPILAFGKAEPNKQFYGLKQADEVGIDKDNNVYIKDILQNQVYIFDNNGNFLHALPTQHELYFFSDNLHPYYEYHEDTKSWKIYNANINGEIEKFIFEIKKEIPAQNIQIIGIDNNNNLYIKNFKLTSIEILKISREGKVIEKFKGHNSSEFDTTRYFFISPLGKVYAPTYNGNNIQIDELEKF